MQALYRSLMYSNSVCPSVTPVDCVKVDERIAQVFGTETTAGLPYIFLKIGLF